MKSEGQRQSRKHEDRLAKKFGGTRTAGSGSFWSRKGDVRTEDLVIEHKFTGKAQFTLKAQVLETVFREAVLCGRIPVLGVHLADQDYIVLTEADFALLRDLATQNGSDDHIHDDEQSSQPGLGVAVFGRLPGD